MLFSTIVEPRTVRAYCTQNDRPIETTMSRIVAFTSSDPPKAALATPSTTSAIRMAGKVSCTSATRMISVSRAPPA